MKFFIVIACTFLAVSASYVRSGHHHHQQQGAYPGPQHIPVIGPNGVPVNTPEVQEATAAHFAQKEKAIFRNGDHLNAQGHHGHHHQEVSHFGHHHQQEHSTYPQHIPVLGPNGVPVETPEVQEAAAAHFAYKEYAQAVSGDHEGYQEHHYEHHHSGVAHPVHTTGQHHYGHHHQQQQNTYTEPQHIPVIGPNGVPENTPEVQEATAAHFAHKEKALFRSGGHLHSQEHHSGHHGQSSVYGSSNNYKNYYPMSYSTFTQYY